MTIEIHEFMTALENISFERSEACLGEKSYAYSYGFFHSVMTNTLNSMNLTKKQKAILAEKLQYWEK